jgi:hypothetical protein
MTEREQQVIEHLTDEAVPRWEAEQIAEDDDLWILDLGVRYAFSGEEGVRQWREAVWRLSTLADHLGVYGDSGWFNEATTMALQDAEARACEALRRAKQRLADAGPQLTVFGDLLERYMARAGISGPTELALRLHKAGYDKLSGSDITDSMYEYGLKDKTVLLAGLPEVLGLSEEEKTHIGRALLHRLKRYDENAASCGFLPPSEQGS